MFTRAERKRRRELLAEMDRLRELFAPDLKKSEGDAYESVLRDYFSELDFPDGELKAIETAELLRRAEKWSIDVPPRSNDETWSRNMAGDFYLTAPSKRDITRRLRDEQRREVRWWWDLVMPLLALLVGLAGVMTSQCPARPTNQIIVGSEPRN